MDSVRDESSCKLTALPRHHRLGLCEKIPFRLLARCSHFILRLWNALTLFPPGNKTEKKKKQDITNYIHRTLPVLVLSQYWVQLGNKRLCRTRHKTNLPSGTLHPVSFSALPTGQNKPIRLSITHTKCIVHEHLL